MATHPQRFNPGQIRTFETIVANGGVTALTVENAYTIFVTGTNKHDINMPDVTTLVIGYEFRIINKSTQKIFINSSGGNQITVLGNKQSAILTCIAVTGTGIASWGGAADVPLPYSALQLKATSDDTVASASTVVFNGKGPQIDVSGTTTISTITLAEGEERIVRFTGALQITKGSSLLTPGGENIPVTAGGWTYLLGGASGVVSVLRYQDANDFSRQTLDNTYMKSGSNIGFNTPDSLPYFDVGRDTSAGDGSFIRLIRGNPGVTICPNDISIAGEGAALLADLLTTARYFQFPDHDGTFATQAGTETLTNKSINASQLTGTIAAARMPALTGDVTSSAGAVATTIANGAVTLAKMANMATASLIYRKTASSGAPEVNSLATLKTDLGLTGTNAGDQTITLTGDVTGTGTSSFATTIAAGAVTFAKLATSAWEDGDPTATALPSVTLPTVNCLLNFVDGITTSINTSISDLVQADTDISGTYKTIMEASASHIAAKVAGTYALSMGNVAAVSGTGTLYPIQLIRITSTDYRTIAGVAPKLRIKVTLAINDVAPTGNYTFGLYPVTRPGTSGGAGLNIYTMGTVVSGSNGATWTAPAADLLDTQVSADFALPADGDYAIAFVSTATVATSSLVHAIAKLQLRNA